MSGLKAYLAARYGDGAAADTDTKKKKKKKKKKKNQVGQKIVSNFQIVDDDATGWANPSLDKKEKKKVYANETERLMDVYRDPLDNRQDGDSDDGMIGAAVVQDAPKEKGFVGKASFVEVGSEAGINPSSSPPPRRRERRDSPDVTDHSPPRRARHDSPSPSPPPRRARHDSPEDQSPPRRARHDSPEDQSPPRRARHDSPEDQSPPRRARHDSPEDQSPPRRARHDSPEDQSPPRRARHDSPEDQSPPRRARHDSPEDQSPPRRARCESPAGDQSPPRRRRQRNNSPDDQSPPRQKRKVSGSGVLSGENFAGGLQSAAEVAAANRLKKARIKEQFARTAPGKSGQFAETVHRDKDGKKLDTALERIRMRREEAKKEEAAEKAAKWGKGIVQQQTKEQKMLDDLREAAKPMARGKNDADMNDMLKAKIHADDPMAQYMLKQKEKALAASGVKLKPKYKGSWPPNRFNIPPGHKWDGRIRTNGFEEKHFKRTNLKKATKADAYKWSSEAL